MMKNSLLGLLGLLLSMLSFRQKFVPNEEYLIVEPKFVLDSLFWALPYEERKPIVDNIHCDGPEPFHEYRFPIQKFGRPHRIIRTESFPNNNYQVDSISLKETITWY